MAMVKIVRIRVRVMVSVKRVRVKIRINVSVNRVRVRMGRENSTCRVYLYVECPVIEQTWRGGLELET